jgi:hypothetical protein
VGSIGPFARTPNFELLLTAAPRRRGRVGSLAFAARHGFVEHDRSSESALELSAFDPDAHADATQADQAHGIRFVTMQEVDSPEMRHRLYPLANQVSLDMPSLMTPMTYEQYVDAWLEAPHPPLDLLVIAVPQ